MISFLPIYFTPSPTMYLHINTPTYTLVLFSFPSIPSFHIFPLLIHTFSLHTDAPFHKLSRLLPHHSATLEHLHIHLFDFAPFLTSYSTHYKPHIFVSSHPHLSGILTPSHNLYFLLLTLHTFHLLHLFYTSSKIPLQSFPSHLSHSIPGIPTQDKAHPYFITYRHLFNPYISSAVFLYIFILISQATS